MCGLADGLDALNRVGVGVDRILLIGGAAQNPAVATIASQVFDVPVVIPEPGQYVAGGAAVQAAWALTGELIHQLPRTGDPLSDSRPEIRAAYAQRPVAPTEATTR